MNITIFMAVSLDGYICGPANETPWSDDEWTNYKTYLSNSDGLIIGRTTYEVMKKANEFETLGKPDVIIVSRSGQFDASSPEKAVAKAKEKGWQSCIVGGGTQLNTSFLEKGLAQKLHLDFEPVILGGGLRLFDSEMSFKLKLIKSETLPSGCISADYTINP